MEIHLIAAVGERGEIGLNGDLPWPKLKEDMKHFKKLTTGWPVIMGRKTWESIPERFRPLSNRHNVVLTTKPPFYTMGSMGSADYARDVEAALSRLKHWNKVYVIGGANVYEQTIGIADQLEITRVKANFDADTFFPEINNNDWDMSWSDYATTKEGLVYEFWTYRKNS